MSGGIIQHMSIVYLRGVQKNAPESELEDAIRKVLLESTNDLSWLKPGDTVLLKPAVNSPYPYPSATHPAAIRVVARELLLRGANVVVGDQSGIGHVMHTPRGVTHGSTLKNFETSRVTDGLDNNAKQVAFEQGDWNDDFFLYKSDAAKHWPNGYYMTRWIEKADHIINLPRLSTHAMAGVTLGFKNLVGLMREDSRIEFHVQGPFFDFMKKWAEQEKFKVDQHKVGDFFEKMTEIALSMKDKMRLTLFVGTQAQTTFGPDRVTYRILGLELRTHVTMPQTGLVFASQDPVAAEAVAVAALADMYSEAPMYKKMLQKFLLRMNGMAKELGTYHVWDNPFVVHALELGLGERRADLRAQDVPQDLLVRLQKALG